MSQDCMLYECHMVTSGTSVTKTLTGQHTLNFGITSRLVKCDLTHRPILRQMDWKHLGSLTRHVSVRHGVSAFGCKAQELGTGVGRQ